MASSGAAAVSLRQIIAEAGTNPASIHYHFGSRDALVEAILKRRMQPIAERRRELLDELEATDAFSVRGGLVVLLRPLLELRGRDGGANSYLCFVAELFRARSELLSRVIAEHFGDTLLRPIELLEAALPELPSNVLALRLWLGMEGVLAELGNPDSTVEDPQVLESLLLDFFEGGLRAPHTVV